MRLGFFLVAFALPALAAPNPSLEKAARLLDDLNYADANRAVEAALKQPGNDRQTLLKALQLQAIILATLGQAAKASQVFSQLLALEPDFALTGNHPPRVTTAFYEARAWAASNGRLEAKALDPVLEPGNVKALKIEVTKDPARQAKKVRFIIDGTPVVSALTGTVATAAPKVKAGEVGWWAEVLGDRDAVLMMVGAETALMSASAPAALETAPVKQAEAPPPPPPAELKWPADSPQTPAPPAPAAAPAPERVVATPEPSRPSISAGRIAGIALFGLGLVAVGAGAAFGVRSADTRAQVDAPSTSMTQKQAYELDARQRMEATIANTAFISGGVLAAGGAALFFLSGSSSRVAIVPTGPGIAVVGALP